MICPRCGAKARVVDCVKNPDDNETYRKHKCVACDGVFYTVEKIAVKDESFTYDWNYYYRKG